MAELQLDTALTKPDASLTIPTTLRRSSSLRSFLTNHSDVDDRLHLQILHEKDTKIAHLKQQLEDLKDRNTYLAASLDSRNSAVRKLSLALPKSPVLQRTPSTEDILSVDNIINTAIKEIERLHQQNDEPGRNFMDNHPDSVKKQGAVENGSKYQGAEKVVESLQGRPGPSAEAAGKFGEQKDRKKNFRDAIKSIEDEMFAREDAFRKLLVEEKVNENILNLRLDQLKEERDKIYFLLLDQEGEDDASVFLDDGHPITPVNDKSYEERATPNASFATGKLEQIMGHTLELEGKIVLRLVQSATDNKQSLLDHIEGLKAQLQDIQNAKSPDKVIFSLGDDNTFVRVNSLRKEDLRKLKQHISMLEKRCRTLDQEKSGIERKSKNKSDRQSSGSISRASSRHENLMEDITNNPKLSIMPWNEERFRRNEELSTEKIHDRAVNQNNEADDVKEPQPGEPRCECSQNESLRAVEQPGTAKSFQDKKNSQSAKPGKDLGCEDTENKYEPEELVDGKLDKGTSFSSKIDLELKTLETYTGKIETSNGRIENLQDSLKDDEKAPCRITVTPDDESEEVNRFRTMSNQTYRKSFSSNRTYSAKRVAEQNVEDPTKHLAEINESQMDEELPVVPSFNAVTYVLPTKISPEDEIYIPAEQQKTARSFHDAGTMQHGDNSRRILLRSKTTGVATKDTVTGPENEVIKVLTNRIKELNDTNRRIMEDNRMKNDEIKVLNESNSLYEVTNKSLKQKLTEVMREKDSIEALEDDFAKQANMLQQLKRLEESNSPDVGMKPEEISALQCSSKDYETSNKILKEKLSEISREAEELRHLEEESGFHLQRLKDELLEKDNILNEMMMQKSKLVGELDSLREELEYEQRKNVELDKQYSFDTEEAKREKIAVHNKLRQMEEELRNTLKERDMLQEKAEQDSIQRKTESTKLAVLENTVSELESKFEICYDEKEELKTEMQNVYDHISALQDELSKSETEKTESVQQLEEANTQIKYLENILGETSVNENKLQEMQLERAKIVTELNGLQEDLEYEKSKNLELDKQYRSTAEEAAREQLALQDKLQQMQNELEKALQERDTSQERIEMDSLQRETELSKLSHLENTISNLESKFQLSYNEKEELKAEMQNVYEHISALKNELSKSETEKTELVQQLEEANTQIKYLENILGETSVNEDKLQEMELERAKIVTELNGLQEDLEYEKSKNLELDKQYRSTAEEAAREQLALQDKLQQIQNELEKALKERNTSQERIEMDSLQRETELSKLSHLENTISNLESKFQLSYNEKKELKAEMQNVYEHISALKNELSKSETEKTELVQQLEEANTQIKYLENILGETSVNEDKLQEMQLERAKTITELNGLQDLEREKSKNLELDKQYRSTAEKAARKQLALQDELQQMQNELEKALKERDTSQQRIEMDSLQRETELSKLSHLENTVSYLESKFQLSYNEKEELKAEMQKVYEHISALRNELSSSETENASLVKQLDASNSKIEYMETLLSGADTKEGQLQEIIERLELNSAEFQYKEEQIVNKCENMKSEIASLKERFESEREDLKRHLELERERLLRTEKLLDINVEEKQELKVRSNTLEEQKQHLASAYEQDINTLRQQIITGEQYKEKLQEELKRKEYEILELNDNCGILQGKLAESASSLDDKNKELEGCLFQKQQLSEQLHEGQNKYECLQQELIEVSKILEEKTQVVRELKDLNNGKDLRNNSLQKELDKTGKEMEARASELTYFKNLAADLKATTKKYDEEQEQTNQEIKKLKEQLEFTEDEKGKNLRLISEYDGKLHRIGQELEHKNKKIESLNQSLNVLKGKNKIELDEKQTKIQLLEEYNKSLKTRLNNYRDNETKFRGKAARMKNALKVITDDLNNTRIIVQNFQLVLSDNNSELRKVYEATQLLERLYSTRVAEMQENIATLQEKGLQLEDENKGLKLELGRQQRECENRGSEADELRNRYEKLQSEHDDKDRCNSRLEENYSELEARLRELKASVHQKEAIIEELKLNNEKEEREAQQFAVKLEKTLNDLRSELVVMRREKASTTEELQQCYGKISKLNDLNLYLTSQIKERDEDVKLEKLKTEDFKQKLEEKQTLDCNEEIKGMKEKIDKLQKDKNEITERLQQEINKEIKSSISERIQRDSLKIELLNLHQETERKETYYMANIEKLNDMVQNLQKQLLECSERERTLNGKEKDYLEKLNDMSKTVTTLEGKLEKAFDDLGRQNRERDDLQEKLSEKNNKLTAKETDLENLAHKCELNQKETETWRKKAESLQSELEDLGNQFSRYRSTNEIDLEQIKTKVEVAKEEQIIKLKKQLAEIYKEKLSYQAKLNDLSSALDTAKKARDELNKEYYNQSEKLGQLKKELLVNQTELEWLRSALDISKLKVINDSGLSVVVSANGVNSEKLKLSKNSS